jgi:hypothetical protein
MLFVGSGLGTFYSRAAIQFFPPNIERMYGANVDVNQVANDSASMAGVIKPIYDVKPFYMNYYDREKIYSIGSGTVDAPYSSYVSLLGESGILGTILYLSLWGFALRAACNGMKLNAGDKGMFSVSAATYAGLIYPHAYGEATNSGWIAACKHNY